MDFLAHRDIRRGPCSEYQTKQWLIEAQIERWFPLYSREQLCFDANGNVRSSTAYRNVTRRRDCLIVGNASKRKVLDQETTAGFEQRPKRPDDQPEKKPDHGPKLARHEIANHSGRYGFSRITASIPTSCIAKAKLCALSSTAALTVSAPP
jgi:hypothetical protein